MVKIREAVPKDKKEFSELILISAPFFPALFGKEITRILQDLFSHPSNLFSFKHVHFAEIEGEKAGMILSYDWKTKKEENLKTGFLLITRLGIKTIFKLPVWMRFFSTVGQLKEYEYYISNIAVYRDYRGKGIGRRLMLKAENQAKVCDAKKMVLDVEKENVNAINFYKKLHYKIINEFSIFIHKKEILHFYRMMKELF